MSNRNWNNDRKHLLKAVVELNAIGKPYNHDDVFNRVNSDTSHSLYIVEDHLSFTDKSVQRTRKAAGTELDRILKASNGRVYLSDGKNRFKAADLRRSHIDAAGLQLNHEPSVIALKHYIDVKGKAKGDGTLERNEPCSKIYVKFDGGLNNKQITEQMNFKLPTSGIVAKSEAQLDQHLDQWKHTTGGWKQQALLAKPRSRGFDDILIVGGHDRFSIMYSAIKKYGKRTLQRKLEQLLPHMKADNTVKRELGYNRARGDGKPSIRMVQEMLKMTPNLTISLTPNALIKLTTRCAA